MPRGPPSARRVNGSSVAAQHQQVDAHARGGQPARAGDERAVPTQAGMQRRKHAQLIELAKRLRRIGLRERQPQLAAQTRARDAPEGAGREGRPGQTPCVRRDLEPEPGGVTGQAQQAGRIVEKAPFVQDPQTPGLEVDERPRQRQQLSRRAGREAQGDRVDREIAPAQILADRRGLDQRQRARGLVLLRARPRHVDAQGPLGCSRLALRRPADQHGGGLEAVVQRLRMARAGAFRQAYREALGVPLDDHVEL